jgi:glycosyltransferase involved in cell wall biosynthesis
MRVNHYRTLPSEVSASMEVYADRLSAALQVQPAAPIVESFPTAAPMARSRLAHYLNRYAVYPGEAWAKKADVHHILDHSYGHLGFGLDPRRTVVTFHDAILLKIHAGELPDHGVPRTAYYGHLLSLLAIRRAARVITGSASAACELLRFVDYPSDRVRVIPHGVSREFLDFPNRPPHRPSGPVRILHVGRCQAQKNVEALLQALPQIRDLLARPVVLVKVGGGFTPAQERLIASLRLEDSIERLPQMPQSELPSQYARCDLLVVPSLDEGFGFPALEAMAVGTPVIAANRGALPEVVGDAGILVDPPEAGVFAGVAARVLADPSLLAQMSKRGRERARNFPWERTAAETLAVYREVQAEAEGARWQPATQ